MSLRQGRMAPKSDRATILGYVSSSVLHMSLHQCRMAPKSVLGYVSSGIMHVSLRQCSTPRALQTMERERRSLPPSPSLPLPPPSFPSLPLPSPPFLPLIPLPPSYSSRPVSENIHGHEGTFIVFNTLRGSFKGSDSVILTYSCRFLCKIFVFVFDSSNPHNVEFLYCFLRAIYGCMAYLLQRKLATFGTYCPDFLLFLAENHSREFFRVKMDCF
jgi:hypothetical protein